MYQSIRWFGEIVGYFDGGTTNGTVEGINNKLKLIKRHGYGFRDFQLKKYRIPRGVTVVLSP